MPDKSFACEGCPSHETCSAEPDSPECVTNVFAVYTARFYETFGVPSDVSPANTKKHRASLSRRPLLLALGGLAAATGEQANEAAAPSQETAQNTLPDIARTATPGIFMHATDAAAFLVELLVRYEAEEHAIRSSVDSQ